MRWRLRRHDPERDGGLVSETESFLRGQYLDIAFDNDADVPAWVWLSVIAHGNEDVLLRARRWLSDHSGCRPELNGWARVLQHEASEILDTAAAVGWSLQDLQRELLVPLELAVTITPVGPATLSRLVQTMLTDAKARVGIDRG